MNIKETLDCLRIEQEEQKNNFRKSQNKIEKCLQDIENSVGIIKVEPILGFDPGLESEARASIALDGGTQDEVPSVAPELPKLPVKKKSKFFRVKT